MGLEDLEPTGQSIGIEDFVQSFDLAGRLGLTAEADVQLLTVSLYTRLVRNPKSARERLLERPEVDFLRRLPVMGHVIESLEATERRRREGIAKLEGQVQQLVEELYPTPEGRQRARAIEMAVNAFVAGGLAEGEELSQSRGKPVLVTDKTQMDQWAAYWRPRIAG